MPGRAVAQARVEGRSGGGHAGANATGVSLPSARWIRRWLECSLHRSTGSLASSSVAKNSDESSSSRRRPLKPSTTPFCHGDPGSMWSASVLLAVLHSITGFEVISGPLSAHRCARAPRIAVSSSSTAATSLQRSRRRTSIARLSRMHSSSTPASAAGVRRPSGPARSPSPHLVLPRLPLGHDAVLARVDLPAFQAHPGRQ